MLTGVRQALRSLLKRPGFAAVAVLTLALGIGANSTIFTYLNAALLESIPFSDFNRVIFIWSSNTQLHGDRLDVSLADFNAWKEARSFDELAAFGSFGYTLTEEGEPERIQATLVTANYFRLLESAPQLGRDFIADEERAGQNRVAVLSHGFWQRRYGGQPNVLGRRIVLDGVPHEIIGVMPKTFWFPRPETAVWMPLALDQNQPRDRRTLWVFGRLKEDVTLEQARSEMDGITSGLEQQFPETNAGWRSNVLLLGQALLKDTDRAVGILLVMTVMFVLLIACVNVANLLLSRAVGREKEIAVRAALGASRRRLIGQLLLESTLLALAGGGGGLLIAFWGGDLLMRVLPHRAPTPDTLINARIFALTMGLSLVSVIVFGLLPALRLSRTDVNAALKETGRTGSGGRRGGRFRSLLVVAEVALTLVLLIAAGLVIRQSVHLQTLDTGFDRERLLTLSLDLPAARYPTEERIEQFYSSALEQLSLVSGVESAAVTTDLPLQSDGQPVRFAIEGQDAAPAVEKPLGFQLAVSADYFRTLGIPILRGRPFAAADTANTPRVAVVSQSVVDRYFGAQDPIGKRLEIGGQWISVIGVTQSVMPDDLRSGPRAQIYVPNTQQRTRAMTVLLRTASDPLAVTPAVRNAIWTIDKDLPVDRVATMSTIFADSFRGGRVVAVLFGVFSVVALALAIVGIYGVISYSASQRTHEIGIRLALGANRQEVLRMVVVKGFLPVSAGVIIGLAGGFAASRVLQGILIGISPSDPLTYIGVTAVLCVVALVASYVPAWRATRVDPMIALRHE